MKSKQIIKITADILMTVILLHQMAYSLVGVEIHEWFVIGIFSLFILHHILNNWWNRNLFRGKYIQFCVLQTVLVVLALASMIGFMVSGIVISRHIGI